MNTTFVETVVVVAEFKDKVLEGLNKVKKSLSEFANVSKMNFESWRKLNAENEKTLGIGGRLANWIRKTTHGLRGFRMEQLSVMFFMMQINRTFTGFLKPAMNVVGVFDIISTILEVLFLPIALKVMDFFLKILDVVLKMPKQTKLLIGGIVLLVAALSWLGMTLAILRLGFGGLLVGGLSPFGLKIMGLIGLAVLFQHAWTHNLFGIRQAFGNLLLFIADVIVPSIKPMLYGIGIGVIFMANMIVSELRKLGLYWQIIWNSMYVAAGGIWNAIVYGIGGVYNTLVSFVNGIIYVQRAIAGLLGLPKWEFIKGIDVKSQTVDITKAMTNIQSAFFDLGKVSEETGESLTSQITWWSQTIESLTPSLESMRNEFIRQGNAIDSGLVHETSILDSAMGAVNSITNIAKSTIFDFGNIANDVSGSIKTNLNPALSNTHDIISNNVNAIDLLKSKLNSLNGMSISYNVYENKYSGVVWTPYGGVSTMYPNYYGDVIWRPGHAPIAISPSDTVVATKGSPSNIVFSPTININAELSSELDIDELKRKLSDEWIDEMNAMMRR